MAYESHVSGRSGARRAPDDAADAAAGPHRAVGKRTLVEALDFAPAPSGAAVQRSASAGASASEPYAVEAAAAHGTSGAAGTLPHLERIQLLFGHHDVSGVRAHVGGNAAEGAAAMGAQAFATGDQVAFASAPDLHTAAHEAAHVVQQRGGVQLKGGVGEAGDPYEQHADQVADAVVHGKSAEGLLDRYAQPGARAGGGGIQRMVEEGLKPTTKVKNKAGEICLVIKAVPGGYMVANTIVKGPPITLKYGDLDPIVADEPESPDGMKKLFAGNATQAPQARMQQATAYIDGLFSKATAGVVTVVPWVQSYSWLALGSYGRQEMCPYSDVELGLVYLINPEQRAAADPRIINDKFAEIGAQVMAKLKALASFVTLDSEGNYPSGKGGAGLTGEAALLPSTVAVARADEAMDARHTMLMDARYVPVAAAGASRAAYDAFKGAMSAKMASKVPGSDQKQSDVSARHLAGLAMQALADGVKDIEKNSRFVNVKKNFRQPLDWALMALCVKHALGDAAGFEGRIAALAKAGVLSGALANAMMDLYMRVFDARIQLHQAHEKEEDTLVSNPSDANLAGHSEEHAKKIGEQSRPGVGKYLADRFAVIANALIPVVALLLEDDTPPPGHWYDGH